MAALANIIAIAPNIAAMASLVDDADTIVVSCLLSPPHLLPLLLQPQCHHDGLIDKTSTTPVFRIATFLDLTAAVMSPLNNTLINVDWD